MKKLILILLIWTTTASAQLLRFATLYTSYSTSAPFVEKQDFLVSGVENFGGAGTLSEITRSNPPGINLTFGLENDPLCFWLQVMLLLSRIIFFYPFFYKQE